MRRVLVTGAAGFIGSALTRALLSEGLEVVALDALTYAGRRDNLPQHPALRFVQAEIGDAEAVAAAMVGVDAVAHLAAETHVDRSLVEPLAFVDTNLRGTAVLLQAARDAGVARFHHVSTDEVYGSLGPDEPPTAPGAVYDPRNPYAATKAGADHLARAWATSFGLPLSLHHGANTYGPRQYPEKLLPLFIARALAGQPLPLYGDGRQRRDWLYVDDHAEAIVAMLRGPAGRTWHVGAGQAVENRQVVALLCLMLDEAHPQGAPHAALVRHVADRPAHDRRYELDTTATARELSWTPRVSLEEGLERTVAWAMDHREHLAAVTTDPRFQAWTRRWYDEEGRG